MAYACRTWRRAAGAESRTEGSIDASINLSSANYNLPGESSGFGDEHSGQFNTRIQHLKLFYDGRNRSFKGEWIETPEPDGSWKWVQKEG
jgi:hypothetical protein